MIRHIISAFFTRGLVALINLAVLLISSHQLGAGIIGQVSIIILNITIIQLVNEIYTGYSLIYFATRFSVRKIYLTGLLWTVLCISLLNFLFHLIKTDADRFWLHAAFLSLFGTLSSFHNVIILSKERILLYNFLVFFQPAVLLAALCINVFGLHNNSVESYISAMYLSFILTLLISGFFVIRLLNKRSSSDNPAFSFTAILRNGFINQAGNLAHTLSNRFNFYLIGAEVLVGIYSRATSLIESVWLISAGITPVLLTRVANENNDHKNSRLTLLLSQISLLLSIIAVAVIIFLPESLFTFLLGPDFAGVKSLMLYLSPGILCICFSTVISHYFSGTGEQRVQLVANSLGLMVTLGTAPFLISRYQLYGACYSASLSYFVQALVLTIVFMKQKELKFGMLFRYRQNLDLLKKNNI